MKINLITVTVCIFLVSGCFSAHAAPPQTMNYQGYLKLMSPDVPYNGAKQLTFRIYAVAKGEKALWTEIHPAVNIAQGRFSVSLGAGSPAVPLTLPFDTPYWLGITVNPETLEMTPRQPLTTTPYAFRAAVADSVTAVGTSSFTDKSVTAAKLDTQYVKSSGDTMTGPLILPESGLGVGLNRLVVGKNSVGIGIDKLTSTLTVAGTIETTSGGVKFPDGTVQVTAKRACAGGRYEDNGDGTVSDCRTGLVWLKNAGCSDNLLGVPVFYSVMTWNEASNWVFWLSNGYCGLTDDSSPGDWRLPTFNEWTSMITSARKQGFTDPSLTNSAGTAKWVQGDPFDNVQYYYWSGTSFVNPDNSISVNCTDLYNGYISYCRPGEKFISVWPVRAGISW